MNQLFIVAHNTSKKLLTTKPTLKEANAYIDELQKSVGEELPDEAFVVQSKQDLSKFNNKELLSLYNTLTSNTLKKFASYNAGLNQVWKFLVPKDAAPKAESVVAVDSQSKEVDTMSFAKRANITKEKAPVKKTTTAKKISTAKKAVPKKKTATKKVTTKKVSTASKLAAKNKKPTATKVSTTKAPRTGEASQRMAMECTVTKLTDYEGRENSIKKIIYDSVDKKSTVESVVAKCKAKHDLDKSTVWKYLRWLRNRDYVTIV